MTEAVGRSRALWNRDALDLRSDEVLAPASRPRRDGRVARALPDGAGRLWLRARIHRIVLTVPVTLPHFWLAALGSLGQSVDLSAPVPNYYEATTV